MSPLWKSAAVMDTRGRRSHENEILFYPLNVSQVSLVSVDLFLRYPGNKVDQRDWGKKCSTRGKTQRKELDIAETTILNDRACEITMRETREREKEGKDGEICGGGVPRVFAPSLREDGERERVGGVYRAIWDEIRGDRKKSSERQGRKMSN